MCCLLGESLPPALRFDCELQTLQGWAWGKADFVVFEKKLICPIWNSHPGSSASLLIYGPRTVAPAFPCPGLTEPVSGWPPWFSATVHLHVTGRSRPR